MAVTAEALRRTNEAPGTRAKLRNLPTSAYKVREVLNLIRNKTVSEALDILQFSNRGAAVPVRKLLQSAVANAVENDNLVAEELFVAACFADEGVTAKRWRPRARGRAGRIRKRSSHITIIVARLDEERLERVRAEQVEQQGSRSRRVSKSRADRVAAGKKAGSTEAAVDAATEEEKGDKSGEATEAAAAEVIAANAPQESETTSAVEAEANAEAETEAAAEGDEPDAKTKTKKKSEADAEEEG